MKKTNSKLSKLFVRTFTVLLLILLRFNLLYAQIESSYYEIQTNENGDPVYFKHQIIIAFSPDLLKKDVIDNKSFIHGKLSDFFHRKCDGSCH